MKFKYPLSLLYVIILVLTTALTIELKNIVYVVDHIDQSRFDTCLFGVRTWQQASPYTYHSNIGVESRELRPTYVTMTWLVKYVSQKARDVPWPGPQI